MMDKPLLRSNLLAALSRLTDEQVRAYSAAITERLTSELAGRQISRVHIYRHHPAWREPLTEDIVHWLEGRSPEVVIDRPLQSVEAPLPLARYDLIIVPTVGFDEACHRLGRGAGWYDRFLAAQQDAFKVGLGYECCKCEALPVEAHDVQLNAVVSEQAYYHS